LEGNQPVSASDVPSKKGNPVPRPLTTEEIYAIIDKYAEAADRAQRSGFDCVEIHAGHSYLLSQFLSPIYNKRTDLKRKAIGNCGPTRFRTASRTKQVSRARFSGEPPNS
jgi:hypothetical protein